MDVLTTTCDRCPAPPKVRYLSLSGNDLVLCAAHARQCDPGLMAKGWQRYALVKVPARA